MSASSLLVRSSISFGVLLYLAVAQPTGTLNYDIQPSIRWESQTVSRVEAEVRITPDGTQVLALGNGCEVTALQVTTGAEAWSYEPASNSSDCSTNSLLFGTTSSGVEYVAVPVSFENVGENAINQYVF